MGNYSVVEVYAAFVGLHLCQSDVCIGIASTHRGHPAEEFWKEQNAVEKETNDWVGMKAVTNDDLFLFWWWWKKKK